MRGSSITDERTLAGWLAAPTEARARQCSAQGDDPIILYADVEEHVVDPASGATKRCDLTLRGAAGPMANAEMKRPEVAQASSPQLVSDAWSKAVGRGLPYFLTCNFAAVLVWETAGGPHQVSPLVTHTLASGLTHSRSAPRRRQEIADNWVLLLDVLAGLLKSRLDRAKVRRPLPPQAESLKEAILAVAEEAAARIQTAVTDAAFRQKVLDVFRLQFGVEMVLDPGGSKEHLYAEARQVATICVFVVSTRLILYQALSDGATQLGRSVKLDPLSINRNTADPTRVAHDLDALYDHARRKTGDFEIQFMNTPIDDIVFVDADGGEDVGALWGDLLKVVVSSDWTGPARYVPGLYEALLDEDHRHIMGVHYTADPLAEIIAAYAIRESTDIVLDPACGAGTFASISYDRKRTLGATHDQALAEVYAIELAAFAASLTGLSLSLADPAAVSAYPRVVQSDFFATYPGLLSNLTLPSIGCVPFPQGVDAVVGNPPYIRFENRSAAERRDVISMLHRRYADAHNAYPDFTGKADVWAFFVAGAETYLREGGRLGFVLSWNLLASDYGDAVISFLSRYFRVDAIIDSRVERWFAAKQNTLLLLCEKLPRSKVSGDEGNLVRFVRLKQPVELLIDSSQSRGKQAEDLVDEILACTHDVGGDLRWDIRVFSQATISVRTAVSGR